MVKAREYQIQPLVDDFVAELTGLQLADGIDAAMDESRLLMRVKISAKA
ncbi:MAG: hypothetical protein ACI8PT_004383 [Gammaproteobacteria bacterium]|jgi:hypothetical protein